MAQPSRWTATTRTSQRFADSYDAGAILFTSQVPIDRWYDLIGIPILADAILDWVVHNAYPIELSGESLRQEPGSRTGGLTRPAKNQIIDHDLRGRRRHGRYHVG